MHADTTTADVQPHADGQSDAADASSATQIESDVVGDKATTLESSTQYGQGLADDSFLNGGERGKEEYAQVEVSQDTASSLLHTTPPISMSAGADPWAEPSAFVPHASEMRKPERDNPWATGSPAPELDDGADKAIATDRPLAKSILQNEHHRQGGEEAQRPSPAARTASMTSNGATQKFSLVSEEREGYDLPKLGHAAARYWSFKPGYLNLNNGSYGACPKAVLEAFKRLEDQQEEAPDHFRLVLMGDLLAESRARVAKVLNCDADAIALITNATTGTNAVLRDMHWKSGDAVLTLSSTYDAVERTFDYVAENERERGIEISLVKVELVYPMSRQAIVARVRDAIEAAQKAGKRIRVGVLDTVASNPGVLLPWKELTALLRSYDVLSLVDAAHGIGHIPIDLKAVDPDFFVSNCHKWMYTHRACAVLYVAPRNRALQRSSLPTSHCFKVGATVDQNTWLEQWTYPGTEDVASRLSVIAALDFRESLGGEARIINYNHDLAVRGGLEAARILGTSVMDDDEHSMTACMANVRLPIVRARLAGGSTDDKDVAAWIARASAWFTDTLFSEFKTRVPIFLHGGAVWARFSAQVWLEVDDFAYGARALLELCRRINESQVLVDSDNAKLAENDNRAREN